MYRDKFLYNSLIENESILYSVEPNGYDVDAFAIHVIKKLDDESLKIIGHEKGAFGRKPMEYNISKLFTKEEVKKQFDIDLV